MRQINNMTHNSPQQIEKVKETSKASEIVVISIFRDKCGHWDFGNFPSDYKILEHKELYLKYLDARYEFEILQEKLIKIAHKKYKSL